MTRNDPAPLRLGLIGRAHGLGGAFRVVGAADWYVFAPGATLLLDGAERKLLSVAGTQQSPILELEGMTSREFMPSSARMGDCCVPATESSARSFPSSSSVAPGAKVYQSAAPTTRNAPPRPCARPIRPRRSGASESLRVTDLERHALARACGGTCDRAQRAHGAATAADQAPDVLGIDLHRDVAALGIHRLLNDNGLRFGGQQPYEVFDELADVTPPRS